MQPAAGTQHSWMPLFTWKPIAGARGYFVVVARDQQFTKIVDVAFTNAPVYAPRRSGSPSAMDFNYPELPSWQRAKELLGTIGRLRHVVVTWNVENLATRLRIESWKTRSAGGGIRTKKRSRACAFSGGARR